MQHRYYSTCMHACMQRGGEPVVLNCAIRFTPSSLFTLNRKEVMNHAHLFVVVVSVQAQIGPFFLTLSLAHTHEHTLALSRNHRGSELTLKPQHFVILYLMEVSVMVEIIQKEHHIRFIVTEKCCVYIPVTPKGREASQR